MTGVDGSARLVEVARQRANAEGLRAHFVVANASALRAIQSTSFDIVMAAMSLMDVADLAGAIAEAHRVLRPGGELVMSITHPCFSAPVSEWKRGSAGELRHFVVDRYFDRAPWTAVLAPRFSAPVVRRHRPLEDYLMVPIEAGFVLREIREPAVTSEELARSHRFRKLARIPYFLFVRWRKV